jgi:hypothetical protein
MAEEPDWIRIQRKTFTRWCNTHLVALNLVIEKLEDDLANGYMLHQLVTVLSQRTLAKPVKAPNSKFQKLQNLNTALDALVKLEGVKLVNISAEDIINGNSKLDLGLIWTLILKYQISKSEYGDDANAAPKRALLEWANSVLNPQGVYVKDFTSSWQDGAGFCGLVNAIEAGSIDLSQLNLVDADERLKNLNKGFEMGEEKFGIAHLIDAEDVAKSPDELSIMSYVSLYRAYLAQVSPDSSKCTAEGPGLTGGKTREKCPFTVITRNEEGELIKRGGAKVTASIVGPDGKETKAVIKDQLNGTYAGTYEVTQPGSYVLTILVVGKPIQDSPFHPEIKPNGPNAGHSYAHGPGVEKAVSGEQTHFTITSVDESGQELAEGGYVFPSTFIDATSGESLAIEVVDNKNGKYTATYTPKTAGNASVIVLLKSEEGESPIKGSPYTVLVVPGDLAVDNVTITGEGLERVVAGEVGEFFVQAKDANLNPLTTGDHALAATFSGPEDVSVDVVNNKDGTYKGSFVPTKIGDYNLDVNFDGSKQVPGAPFKVQVVPAAPSADNTVASGEGLNKAEAGVAGHFAVEVRDRFDNPVGHGGDSITALITPNAEGSEPVTAHVTDNGDGTYKVDYAPLNKAGDYTVEVKLSEAPIKDAPFALTVATSSAGSDPEKSFVVGLQDAVAGEKQAPVVHSVDQFGNPLVGGGDKVELTLSGPEDVAVNVVDNGDGTYTADYTPTKAGEYTATVKINGNEVKDSPFTFNVVPAAVSPGHCVASGPGISRGKADKPAPFSVQLRDQFDNDIKENPGSVCEAVIVLQEKRRAHEYPDSSDDEGKEKPQEAEHEVNTPITMNDNTDGTFAGAYSLKAAGSYSLEITVDGAPIRDAPFAIRGNPGRPHIPNSVVRGARKGRAGVDGARIILKDAQGNPRHKGGQQLSAKLNAIRDPEVIKAIDNGDGSYTIPYPPEAKGKYGMSVFCGDEPIPGAFGVDVSETPLKEEESAAISSALPSSGATVAALMKQAPLAEREKLAAELAALTAAAGGAPAPVADTSAADAKAAAAEQKAAHAEQKAAAAEAQNAALSAEIASLKAQLAAAAAAPAASPVVEEPVAEEPVTEEPVAEEHVAEEPVAEEPVAEEPAAEEPVAEEPIEEEPVAEEPAAEEPVAEEVVAEEPVAEEPVAEEPVAEEVVAEEPVAEEPVAEEPVAEEPAAEPVHEELQAPEEPVAAVAEEAAAPAEEEPVSPKKKKSKSSKSLKKAEAAAAAAAVAEAAPSEPAPAPAAEPSKDSKKSKSKKSKKKK